MRRTPFIFACCIVLMSPAFAATTLTLDYPRGGEVFVVGTTQQVKLSGRYKTGSSVAVELSRDGGGTFTALGTITVARNITPTLQFPVTEPASSNCVVKVSIQSTQGVAAQSASASSAPFAIVLSLNGGGAPAPAVLADGSVTNPKIAPAAVTTDKISSAPASSGFVLTADGNGNADWSPLPAAGTVTNVLGSGAVTVSNGTSTPLIIVADATTNSKGVVQIGSGLAVTNGVVSNSDAGSVQNIFKNIADQTGTTKFSATSNNDSLQVQGTGAASVTFDAVNKRIVINATDTNSGGTVTSVTGGGPIAVANGTTTPSISIAVGSTAGTVAAGNDARLSDARTASNSSLTSVASKIPLADGAGKIDDAWLTTNIVRTTDARLNDARVASNSSLTSVASKIPLADGAGKIDDAWLTSNIVCTSDARLSDSRPASSVDFNTATLTNTVPAGNLPVATLSAKGIVQVGAGLAVTAGTVSNADAGSAQNIFKNIADSSGTTQFAATTNTDSLQVQGTGAASVSFDSVNKRIVINATDTNSGGTVTSVSGGGPISVTNGTTTPNIAIAVGSTAGTVAAGNDARLSDARPASSVDFNAATLTNTVPAVNLPVATLTAKGVVQVGSGLSVTGGTVSNADAGSAQNIFKNIADSTGTAQFSATTNTDSLQVQGTGAASVSFDSVNRRIVINATDTNSGGTVTSVTGSGAVSVINGTSTPAISITESALSLNNIGGTLNATKGGTGSTSLSGLVVGNGAGAMTALKTNLTAIIAPTVNDDNTAGYIVGSRWCNTVAKTEYVLTDASTGAAVWTATTSGVPSGYMIIGSTPTAPVGYTYTGAFISNQSSVGWSAKASVPTARLFLAGATVNNVIYAIGGNDNTNNLVTNEAYDPSTNTWTTKAAMPTARGGLAAATVGNVIYAIGGNNAGRLTTNEAYDPSTDSWTTKAAMPTARSSLATATVANVIYAIGGDSIGGAIATNEAYDPSSDSWTTKAVMPTARDSLAAAMVTNVIYAIGGNHGSGVIATNEAYDPSTNSWTTKAAMPTPRQGLAAAIVGNVIFAVGGFNGLGTNEAYDPSTNSWTTKPTMLTTGGYFASGVVGNVIYVIGGATGLGGPLSGTNEAYDTTVPFFPTLFLHSKN